MSKLSAKLRKYVQEANLDGVEDDVQKAADELDAKDAIIAELVACLNDTGDWLDMAGGECNAKMLEELEALQQRIAAALSKASQD